MIRQHFRNTYLYFIALLFAACSAKPSPEAQTNYILRGDTIMVPEQSTITAKLKTETVTAVPYRPELLTTGTVRAIPNFYAEIAPPFSGRVTKVYLHLGMKTRPGTPLFEMISPDFTAAQKVFFQARSGYQVARLSLQRQQDLKANGVGAQKELEEARTSFEISEKEYQNAVAGLHLFGVDINKLVLGQALVITSPVAGSVITNDVVLGQYIKAEDPPRARVADLQKVWVAGQVKEKDLGFISRLEKATIQVAAYPGKTIPGKVYHVEQLVNETTRSVQVLIECSNTEQLLKPGMYVTVSLSDTAATTLFVPAKAVLQYNDRSFVFVQAGKGKYLRRYVETGITNNGKLLIRSGLHAGEMIISEGAIYLLDAK